MWFEELVGFAETTGEEVRSQLVLKDGTLTSMVTWRAMECGRLETPSLGELRAAVMSDGRRPPNTVRELVADVVALHQDPANAGAFFQVASQFNLLEMVSPAATPEMGVDGYENDHTQGPACAIACGAGTVYRNWYVQFASQPGEFGQTANRQIDCLADLGRELVNYEERLWTMRNGYALASASGLSKIADRLRDPAEIEQLRQFLRIGLQLETEVTQGGVGHKVSQAYCSALPVAYSEHSADLWEPFARLVLEAGYEATLLAAARNADQTGNRKVFLTLVGGGAFGNRVGWIIDAIRRAVKEHPNLGLDIAIVSYGRSQPAVAELVAGVLERAG